MDLLERYDGVNSLFCDDFITVYCNSIGFLIIIILLLQHPSTYTVAEGISQFQAEFEAF
jgi:hypothetical protein